MGFLLPFLPAAASLAGGLLTQHSKNNAAKDANAAEIERQRMQDERDRQAQQAQYNMGRGGFERNATAQAALGGVGGDLLSKWFPNIDPGQLEKLRTPTAYPDFEFAPGGQVKAPQPIPGYSGFAGNFLSGIAPYIGLNQNQQSPFEQYMAQHPNTAANLVGETYGPPAVGSLNPEFDPMGTQGANNALTVPYSEFFEESDMALNDLLAGFMRGRNMGGGGMPPGGGVQPGPSMPWTPQGPPPMRPGETPPGQFPGRPMPPAIPPPMNRPPDFPMPGRLPLPAPPDVSTQPMPGPYPQKTPGMTPQRAPVMPAPMTYPHKTPMAR